MAASQSFMPDVDITKLAPPMHLSVDEYNNLLLEHGSAAEYRKAIFCPCIRVETRQAVGNCKHCRGLGWLYPEHMRGPMIVLDTSRTSTLKWAAAGLMAQGQITLTFPCGELPGIGDMILPCNDVHVVQEHLIRNVSQQVTDRHTSGFRTRPHQRPTSWGKRDERLTYPDPQVECITYETAEGELVFADPTTFNLTHDGVLTWQDGHGPEPGHAASVRYRAPAAYVIQGASPLLRREGNVNMPYRATAQRLDKVSVDDLR